MRNLLLIALAIFIGISTSQAQAIVEYSASFDEPENGWRKVLQLSNGNTFFFNYYGKDGIDITVYDKSRKQIAQKNIEGAKWEPKEYKQTKIAGLYEIGGSPTLFVQQVIKRTPHLFRFVFNPQTGALQSEELISTLQKFNAGMGFALSWGGVEEPAFHVEKCPTADYYTVINFNSISPESDERISVKYYGVENGQHKVLSDANYDAQGYKYVNYVASYTGDDAVYISAYGFNTKNSGGEDSRLIISRLNKGSNSFTHNKIEFTDDFADTRGIMTFNPGSSMLQMLTLTYLKKKSNMWSGNTTTTYLPLLTHIDPKSLQIVKAKILTQEYAATRVKESFKEKNPFSGMPQYMIVNKDNSTSVIVEEMLKTQQVSYGQTRTLNTFMGHIGITEFDISGKETIGYAAKKAQKASGDMSVFNLTDRVRGKWSYAPPTSLMGDNSQFFSFNYVNTENGKYLIFNDLPENFHKKDADNIKTIAAASEMNTVYYELKNGFFVKHFLFDAPKGDDDLSFANIASADFMDETNTFATLMVKRNGRKKEAHIAWVKFK